jgi:hypothetical protein
MRKLLVISLLLTLVLAGFGQSQPSREVVTRSAVHNGDTIPLIVLKPTYVWEKRTWKSRRQQKKYEKLKKKVVKVYPYAKLAGKKLREYASILDTVQTERQKKKFYKQIEEELKQEYGADLKKLTMSEGRILIKLIDRETGDTSYELVEDLRGQFTAFFWQSFARLFGHNLKTNYDPSGADREIEFIVQQIEAGYI